MTPRERMLQRENEALRRLSRAVSTNQTRIPIAFQSAHALQGSLDLAGVLIWAAEPISQCLVLLASAGMHHPLPEGISTLPLGGAVDMLCTEAFAAGRPVWAPQLGPTLESAACKSETGAACALPLGANRRAVGVMTLLAKTGDEGFLACQDLHMTLAETLALALESAWNFESVERLATIDPLTGIANHRSLQTALAENMRLAQEGGFPVSVAMIDVDHFRQFNEEEGHDCGDDVLRLVAAAIAGQCRRGDLAARYGGEEFTLVMPNADPVEAMHIVEATRQEIQAISFATRSGKSKTVTASIGVATFPDSGITEQEILKAADTALYRAKRTGRNRSVYYQPEFASSQHDCADALVAVRSVCPMDLWAEGEALQARSAKLLARLSAHAGLTETVVGSIKSALLLWPSWESALEQGDAVFIQTLCSAQGLTGAGRALAFLHERFDGAGKHRCLGDEIPIEARILAALLAYNVSGKRGFGRDAGRFDPAIAKILIKGAHAA